MATTAPRRTLLGTTSGLSSFSRVYRTADAVEVDEVEGTDVTRRRVLLEEVLLVTHHREYGTAFVVTMLAVLTVFGGISAIAATVDLTVGLVLFGFTGLPPLLALAFRLVLGLDVVTVFGRRTRATVHFSVRKARAREVYLLLCRMARERQARLTRERARPKEAPPPPAAPAAESSRE
jgi:hypothetical protein